MSGSPRRLSGPSGRMRAWMLDLPDVNALVALVLPKHVHHERAQTWWSGAARYVTTPVTETGLCWWSHRRFCAHGG